MGLGGFILGGALAGAGKGMAMEAEQTALERREARLAAARQAERTEDREWRKEDLQIAEDSTARRDQRLHNQDLEKEGVKFGNQVSLADKGEKADAAKETREEQRTYRLEAFRSQLKINESAADARIAKQLESGEITDILETEDGSYVAVTKGGKTRPLGIKAKPEAASGTSLLANRPAGADPEKPTSVNSGKILTRTQLVEAAKASGKSEAQMEAEAKRLGFTIR